MRDRNLIQNPELLLRLRRGLRIRGERTVTPTLNNGVQAVVVIEDLTKVKLRVDELFAGVAVNTVAVAGQSGVAMLANPVGSGMLIRPIKTRVHHGGAWTANFQRDVALATALEGVPLHGRAAEFYFNPGGSRVVGLVRAGTSLGLTGVGSDTLVRTDDTLTGWSQWDWDVHLVLYPGDALAIISIPVNFPFNTSWTWREEQLGQGAEPLS